MSHRFDVTQNGSEAVARFRSVEFPHDSLVEHCRCYLETYLENNPCEAFTFDLEGVAIIPSTMLGLLLTIRQRGIPVRIANPSEDVLTVLEVTKLNTKFDVVSLTPAG